MTHPSRRRPVWVAIPRRLLLPVLLALLIAGTTAQLEGGAKPEPTFGKQRAAAFDAAMEAERERQGLVGLAVAVIEKGQLAHVGGYGRADGKRKRTVTARTLFRWASVSKPVTAVAALQLVERGKMKLSDPAGKYWKGLPKGGLGAVPLEALLRHQGGVGHYREMGDWRSRLDKHYRNRARVPWAADKSVAVLVTAPLLSRPFERYHYTTFGYNLVGALVEGAGKKPFEAQVEERIARPLGMTTFEPDYEFVKRAERTEGFRKKDGRIVPSESGDVSWKLPGGGFHSSVGDMARFGAGLLSDALLRSETRKQMWSIRKPDEGASSYALGIGVRRSGGVVTRLSHSGAQSRTRTLLVLDPPNRRGFAIMTNCEWGEPSPVWRAAEKALGW